MSLRKKLCMLYAVWFILGVILILGSMYITSYFIIPLIVVVIIIGIIAMNIRCPYCNKSVLSNKIKLFGFEFIVCTPWIPNNCPKCGKALK